MKIVVPRVIHADEKRVTLVTWQNNGFPVPAKRKAEMEVDGRP